MQVAKSQSGRKSKAGKRKSPRTKKAEMKIALASARKSPREPKKLVKLEFDPSKPRYVKAEQ